MTRSIAVGRHLRLVALHVDEDVGLRQLAGDFGDAVGAALAIGARHHEVAAEALDLARRSRRGRWRPRRRPAAGAREAASYVCWRSDLPVSRSSIFRGSRVEA